MGTKVLPGKGGFFHLNGDTLEFFEAVMTELNTVIEDMLDDVTSDLNELLDKVGAEQVFADLITGTEGWQFEKDDFGQKLYRAMDWQGGQYRITVVLTKKGALGLDIRSWYDPNAQR